jgi:DNA segregation ATPase FtsK/SpoIIIE, S-DNA-T family
VATHVARRRRPASRSRARGLSIGPQARELIGLALVALGAFLGLLLFAGLSGGPVGRGLETLLRLLVGRAVALAPLALVLIGLSLILRGGLLATRPFRLGAAVTGVALLVAFAAGTLGGGGERHGWFDVDTMKSRGGASGESVYYVTDHLVGGVGTAVLVVAALVAGLVLLTGASLGHVLRRSGRGAAVAGRAVGRGVSVATEAALQGGRRIGENVRTLRETGGWATAPPPSRSGSPRPPLDGADHFPDLFGMPGALPPSPALGPEPEEDEHPTAETEPGPEVPEAQDQDDGRAALQPDLDDEADEAAARPPEPEPARPARRLRPPSRNLLRRSTGDSSLSPALVRDTSRRLEETLGHFGISAAVTDTVSGPRVTRYELQLAPGTKVSRVSALRDDLAYSLAARDEIRIIAPIPGKQAVGVEVPNPQATLVTLGDIYRDFPPQAGPLVAWLGLDIGGKAVFLDIARMPHLLIAGSTGTGKSVCLNALLASILLRATPAELRMVLIDPKKVELNHYESIPHLLTPVVTNMKNATAVLANLVREMESRYELMGLARARNLRDWNDVRAARGEPPMPMILVVIDELADLMIVSPAEVEDAIIRLAQKSRAVGIHLVLATQRPSVDVITGMIKANVPSRIAFAVSSQIDSRVILDASGAEALLGGGDMLFRPIGTGRLQRLQGAYVSEDEIRSITDDWRRQGKPQLREELMERPEADEDAVDPDADDLIERAVELVVAQGTASVSLLQRRLGVGYARAGRLVDMMERMGVISGHEGSKPRSVLIGEADLDRVLRRAPAAEDASDEEG